jgi:hypothetical protein
VDGICSCWLAQKMDFHGLHNKASLTSSTFTSLLHGMPGQPSFQRQLSVSYWYHPITKYLEGVYFLNIAQYSPCINVTDCVASFQK